MRIPSRVAASTLLAAATAAVAWGEWVHRRAATMLVNPDPVGADRGSEAILCLGYRNRPIGRANAANRWRVRAALRSIDPAATHSRVIFCGASHVPGALSEAALMAAYAVDELGFDGEVALDEESRTTWENIERARALIGDPDRIKIVSHSLHALKGRMYLHRQAPDLARRLVPGSDYRLGELLLLKPLLAVYGFGTWRRAGRFEATALV